MSGHSKYPGSKSLYGFTGTAPRVSPTGVRQLGTNLGIGPVQIPQMNAVQGASVQLPNSMTSKLQGIAPNQDQYEPEAANLYQAAFNADPNIANSAEIGKSAAGYVPASADTELAFNGQTDMGAGMGFQPQPEAPYKSTFGEFEGIEGGRLGAALGGVQENIISGKQYLQNSDLTRDSVEIQPTDLQPPAAIPQTPAPNPQSAAQTFADEKVEEVKQKLVPQSSGSNTPEMGSNYGNMSGRFSSDGGGKFWRGLTENLGWAWNQWSDPKNYK